MFTDLYLIDKLVRPCLSLGICATSCLTLIVVVFSLRLICSCCVSTSLIAPHCIQWLFPSVLCQNTCTLIPVSQVSEVSPSLVFLISLLSTVSLKKRNFSFNFCLQCLHLGPHSPSIQSATEDHDSLLLELNFLFLIKYICKYVGGIRFNFHQWHNMKD